MKRTIIRNEKGSITIFVLIAMIFFLLVLVGVFLMMQNRQKAIADEVGKVKENYGSDISLDELYTKITGETPFVTETTLEQIYQTELRDKAHPVGSILTTSNSANPGTYMPGTTWVAWGQGRSPLGIGQVKANTYTGHGAVAAGATNLTTVEMMGGSHLATMPAHTHRFSGKTEVSNPNSHTHTSYYYAGNNRVATGTGRDTPGSSSAPIRYSKTTSSNGAHTHIISGATTTPLEGTNAFNYTPYITEYMWKRVS